MAQSDQTGKSGRQDRRVTRSRRAIMDAFKRLASRERLNDITVTAVAREADVDRKTVYAHFGSIDGLFDAFAADIVESIMQSVEQSLSASAAEDGAQAAGQSAPVRRERRITAFFEELNRSIYRNLALNRNIALNLSDEEILGRVRAPLERAIIERGLIDEELAGERFEWIVSYVLGGIMTTYRMWLNSGMKKPLEEVSAMAHDITLWGLSFLDRGTQPAAAL